MTCDVDDIRARTWMKGGPDEARARESAVQDRDELLALVDALEDEIGAVERDRDELVETLAEAAALARTLRNDLRGSRKANTLYRRASVRPNVRRLCKLLAEY